MIYFLNRYFPLLDIYLVGMLYAAEMFSWSFLSLPYIYLDYIP